jgi:hypothetical protein
MNIICDKCKYVSGFSSEFPCNRCVVIAINCFVPNNAALNSEELAATVPAVAAANTASKKFPSSTDVWNSVIDHYMDVGLPGTVEQARSVSKVVYDFLRRKLLA